ncbi:ribokinase [Asticcacaulis sp. ZE23SCel15]|uniref:ribokinase n=1 Tax=Asticcacaulis sp. ZE23SCel15 TaxID=3059027 RepID=UPI00265DD582|nr:ribokinase [Asticcacaulis sp. ZE23SCel15]WKL57117.1 ribokinase [Asticcacaulis sp. ZE23SCel15]
MSTPAKITPKIVVVGSINADFIVEVKALPRANETVMGKSFTTVIGGKGLNQAVAMARLGCDTRMVGAVGDDAFGEQARAYLKANGVNDLHVETVAVMPTGTAHITVAHDGQNTIAVAPGANACITPEMIDAAAHLIAVADVVVVQLEIPLEAVRKALEIARAHGVKTILNPAPVDMAALDLMPLADVVTPNDTELSSLTGIEGLGDATLHAALHALSKAGAGQVVATLGSNGCAALIEGTLIRLPAFRVEAVDATGAGDVFNGALACELAGGRSLIDALEFASAAAAISVSRPSANSAPTRAEVEAFLSETV